MSGGAGQSSDDGAAVGWGACPAVDPYSSLHRVISIVVVTQWKFAEQAASGNSSFERADAGGKVLAE